MAAQSESSSGAAGPGKKSGSSAPLFLALGNSLIVLAAVGLLAYTKLVYKRPVITESGEREKIKKAHELPPIPVKPLLMNFDPQTVNIESNPFAPKAADGTSTQLQGKLHYATLGFSLEVRDEKQKNMMEELRPVIMDLVLNDLGHKKFQELNNFEGRDLLKSQLVDQINDLANAHRIKVEKKKSKSKSDDSDEAEEQRKPKEIFVTNLFFTQFVVQ